MKTFLIFLAVALLASCQKDFNQITVIETKLPENSRAVTELARLDTSGKFKWPVTPVAPDSPTLSPFQTLYPKMLPIGSAEFVLIIGSIRFRLNDSVTAKEYIQDGSEHIFIEARKDPHTYQINITGTGTQNSPFDANSSMFLQWQYDYGIEYQDFSLKVVNYENGYLNAIFHTSNMRGIINHLKVTP